MPTVIASLRSNPEALIVSNLHKLVIGSLRSNPKKTQWIASQARNDVIS